MARLWELDMFVKTDDQHMSDETRRSVAVLTRRVDALTAWEGGTSSDKRGRVGHFAQVACVAKLRLHMVPFYEPCLIFVLSGVKQLGGEAVGAGGCLAVPAPSSFHMANEPDPATGHYKALVVAFDQHDLDHVRGVLHSPPKRASGREIVTYGFDAQTTAALLHYLDSQDGDSDALLAHRKREILLLLAQRNPELLVLMAGDQGWGQRVRAVLAGDPAASWSVEQVCRELAVTESTLRRHLRREGTGFREVLAEFRLSNALMALLMSDDPVYAVALDNGYQSVSRFSENFKKRFGLTPTQVRERLPESG